MHNQIVNRKQYDRTLKRKRSTNCWMHSKCSGMWTKTKASRACIKTPSRIHRRFNEPKLRHLFLRTNQRKSWGTHWLSRSNTYGTPTRPSQAARARSRCSSTYASEFARPQQWPWIKKVKPKCRFTVLFSKVLNSGAKTAKRKTTVTSRFKASTPTQSARSCWCCQQSKSSWASSEPSISRR